MLVLSVVFLAGLVTPVLDPHLSSGWTTTIAVVDISVWGVFAAEYAIRLILAPRKLRFIWTHPLDLVVVAVPVLRPVQVARLARLARVGALTGLVRRRTSGRLHIDVAVQVIVVAVIIVLVGAFGMLDVERGAPGANIHNFGDALWWALSTVTTVGYGDKYPVTGEGHLIGAALMVTGVVVFGVITAGLGGWFVENIQRIERDEARETSEVARLESALREVLDRLARIEAGLGTDRRG